MRNKYHVILNHPNSKYFLLELLNGTHNWLFSTLAGLNENLIAKDQMQEMLSKFIRCLYSQHRFFKLTNKSFADFFDESMDGRQQAMKYILNTLATKFNGDFEYAIIAPNIAVSGQESEFEAFLKEAITEPKMDIRTSLIYFDLYVFCGESANAHK
jgi:hypothetical protein